MFTNKPIVTPVRGAGRQHGVFVSERLLDIAAKELGHRSRRDPQAEPARSRPLPAQPRDHVPGLGAARLRQRQLPADARAGGRDDRLRAAACASRHGCAPKAGTSASASSATSKAPAIGPYEGARVTVEPSGHGARRHRRRHAGTGALHRVRADRRRCARRGRAGRRASSPATRASSTGAPARSRAAARSSPAARVTRRRCWCARRSLALASQLLGVAGASSSSWQNGRVAGARTHRNAGFALGELAAQGELRCAAPCGPASEPGLESTAYFGPDRGSTASGVHAVLVEVDPETAMVDAQALRRRARLRHDDQPAAGRGADPRRRRARHRQRVLRAARLRRAGAAA